MDGATTKVGMNRVVCDAMYGVSTLLGRINMIRKLGITNGSGRHTRCIINRADDINRCIQLGVSLFDTVEIINRKRHSRGVIKNGFKKRC